MKTNILRLLNADAKEWWYHQELRKQGNPTEARKRERRSITEHVAIIREALTNGAPVRIRLNKYQDHWGLSYSKLASISGYGCDRPLVLAFMAAGIPTVQAKY